MLIEISIKFDITTENITFWLKLHKKSIYKKEIFSIRILYLSKAEDYVNFFIQLQLQQLIKINSKLSNSIVGQHAIRQNLEHIRTDKKLIRYMWKKH